MKYKVRNMTPSNGPIRESAALASDTHIHPRRFPAAAQALSWPLLAACMLHALFARADSGPFGEWTPLAHYARHHTSVAYGNGIFVVVGVDTHGGAAVITSADGDDWVEQTGPPAQALNSIAFGNGRFVAVGGPMDVERGKFSATSSDGVHWTVAKAEGKYRFRSVAFGKDLFVACDDEALFTSPEGLVWTRRPVDGLPFLRSVVFGDDRFICTGAQTALVSKDGITWSPVDSGASAGLGAIVFGNDLLVGLPYQGVARSLTGGETWEPPSDPGAVRGAKVDLSALGYANGTFVVAGEYSSHTGPVLFTSDDAKTWRIGTPVFSRCVAIGQGAGRFVALGAFGGIATSLDGANWTVRRVERAYSFSGQARRAGVSVLVGSEFLYSSRDFANGVAKPVVFRSTNGVAWDRQAFSEDATLTSVAFGDGRFVALGYTRQGGGLSFTSEDGGRWIRHDLGPAFGGRDLIWANGRFVAVWGQIVSSTNGVDWTVSLPQVPGYTFANVAYGNGMFVAAAGITYSTAGLIYSSPDGLNWTRRDSGPGKALTGVTFGNGRFLVARWYGPYLTSSDGISWTSHDLGGSPVLDSKVSYSGLGVPRHVAGHFIAEGTTSWISSDLESWEKFDGPRGAKFLYGDAAVAGVYDGVWSAPVLHRPYLVSVAGSHFSTESGNLPGTFRVERTGALALDLAVDLSIGGTAAEGVDFTAIPKSVTIPAGKRFVEFSLQALPDGIAEADETVIITVRPGDDYDVGPADQVTLAIKDSLDVAYFRSDRLIVAPDGAVTIALDLPPAGSFVVETSDDLKTWTESQTIPAGSGYSLLRAEAASAGQRRFYRARLLAP